MLRRTAGTLAGPLQAGIPVVALEPSCTSVLRGDAAELFRPAAAGGERLGRLPERQLSGRR